MFTTTSKSLSNSLSFFIYGISGVGKTTSASTFDNKNEILIVNIENGLRSVADFDIAVYDVTVDQNGKELPRATRHDKFLHALKILQQDDMKQRFKIIFFDSLTEISQNLVEKLKTIYPDKKDSMKLWGDYNDNMLNIVKSIRDLRPYITVVTALDKVEVDEFQRRFHGVDIAGKIASRIPAFFDEVFYLGHFEIDGEKRRMLLTNGGENYIAKDRSGKLNQLESPNLQTILNKVMTISSNL